LKGEKVRSELTKWVSSNRPILLKLFSKSKLFTDDVSEDHEIGNDDMTKETELEINIPSGGSALEVANSLLVALYNAEMSAKSKTVIIDTDDSDNGSGEEDNDEGTEKQEDEDDAAAPKTAKGMDAFVPVEDIDDIPQTYLGTVCFYVLKILHCHKILH
jgi:hypothetical protein